MVGAHSSFLYVYICIKFLHLWLCWVFDLHRLLSGCSEWVLLFITSCRLFIVLTSLDGAHAPGRWTSVVGSGF